MNNREEQESKREREIDREQVLHTTVDFPLGRTHFLSWN